MNVSSHRDADCQRVHRNFDPEGNSGCQLVPLNLLGFLRGGNLNVKGAQPFTMLVPHAFSFRVTKLTLVKATADINSVSGGVYAGDTLLGLLERIKASPHAAVDLPMATLSKVHQPRKVLSLHVSTPQGTAANADVYAYGDVYL